MDAFKSYRIFDWYYYLGYILLGFLLKSSLNISIIKHFLLGAFLLAYAFSFNIFCDKNEKKKFFLLPLTLSFLMLPLFNLFQTIISLIFLIIVTFYSAYPFRWKVKPFLSSLCNGFGFTIIFLLGYFYIPNITIEGLLFSILIFCFNMVAQFIHEIVHEKVDKKNKIITTTVFYGERTVRYFCYLFLLLSLLITFYLLYMKFINIIFFVITTSFIIFFIIEIYRKNIDKSFREKYKILGILIGFIYFISLILKNLLVF